MDELIITMSVVCFLTSLLFLAAEWSDDFFIVLFFKVLGIIGVILPIIFWLKLLNWI